MSHIKINTDTLNSVLNVLDELIGAGYDLDYQDNICDAEDRRAFEGDIERVRRFLDAEIPHSPSSWHLVSQATANDLTNRKTHVTLGLAAPDTHI
jgi:hypothetical protein